MPDLLSVCQWLENAFVGRTIRESSFLFPAVESLHLFGIVLLVGATSILDLRLLGVSMRNQSVTKLAGRTLPWAWAGLIVMLTTGSLMFISEATRCYNSTVFRIKILMMVIAGMNALVFHAFAYRSVGKWDVATDTPIAAKLAGAFSVLLWFGIVAAGRWIAFA